VSGYLLWEKMPGGGTGLKKTIHKFKDLLYWWASL